MTSRGVKCWKFTMKPVKLEEVAVAADPKLTEAWEAKKAEARKSIRMARKQLTQEVQGWDRMLSKYEARVTQGGGPDPGGQDSRW